MRSVTSRAVTPRRLGDQHNHQRQGQRPDRSRPAAVSPVRDEDGRQQQCDDRRDYPVWAQAEPRGKK